MAKKKKPMMEEKMPGMKGKGGKMPFPMKPKKKK